MSEALPKREPLREPVGYDRRQVFRRLVMQSLGYNFLSGDERELVLKLLTSLNYGKRVE